MKQFSEMTKEEKMEVNFALGKIVWEANLEVMKEAEKNKRPCSQHHDQKEWYCVWAGDYEFHSQRIKGFDEP